VSGTLFLLEYKRGDALDHGKVGPAHSYLVGECGARGDDVHRSSGLSNTCGEDGL